MACFSVKTSTLELVTRLSSANLGMHPIDNPSVLLPLLQDHLPFSLPAYGALKSGSPISAWASFVDPSHPGEIWVIVILLLPPSHDQYRIYCSAEKHGGDQASPVVLNALKKLSIQPKTMLGAVCTLWAEGIIQEKVREGRASSYNVWLSNEETRVEDIPGYEIGEGREEDIANVSDEW